MTEDPLRAVRHDNRSAAPEPAGSSRPTDSCSDQYVRADGTLADGDGDRDDDGLRPMRPVDPAQLRPTTWRPWQVGLLAVSSMVGVCFAGLTLLRGLLAALDKEFTCGLRGVPDCRPGFPVEAPIALLMVVVGFGVALAVPKRGPGSWVFALACLVVLVGPIACLYRM